jgi:hypothetical protein
VHEKTLWNEVAKLEWQWEHFFITQHAAGNAQTVSQNQLSSIDLRAFSLLSMQLKMDGQCRETN